VTHSFDENARALPLSFTQTAGGLDVQMPADGNTAPPGYYMLFIVNDKGVPSIAAFVRFPAPYEDASPPTKPAGLERPSARPAASRPLVVGGDRRPSAVLRYDIYRSTDLRLHAVAGDQGGAEHDDHVHRQRRPRPATTSTA